MNSVSKCMDPCHRLGGDPSYPAQIQIVHEPPKEMINMNLLKESDTQEFLQGFKYGFFRAIIKPANINENTYNAYTNLKTDRIHKRLPKLSRISRSMIKQLLNEQDLKDGLQVFACGSGIGEIVGQSLVVGGATIILLTVLNAACWVHP